MNSWYIRTDAGEIGPFTEPEIMFLIRKGAVATDDLVKSADTSAWTPLQNSTLIQQSLSNIPRSEFPRTSDPIVNHDTKSPAPHTKSPDPVSSVRHFAPPIPQFTPQPAVFQAKHGVAAAAVAVLLIAVLVLFGTLAPRLSGPRPSPSANNKDSDQNTPAAPSGAQQSATNDNGAAPNHPPEELVASASPVTGEPDGPAEAPEPAPTPAETPPADNVPSPPDASENRFETGLPSVSRRNDADTVQLPAGDPLPSLQGSDLRGRSPAGRAAAITRSGGDEDSERSVALALEWLKSIQQADGSWSFQNVGPGARPGNLNSNSAATTLAVLCFLGAGNTTTSGPDAATVSQAFAFLVREAEASSSREPETLYVSALATIAFSELAAMEPKNVRAKSIAASLLTFLQQSQDQAGGGWRYHPGDPGDLSVTGWQIMALQSARTCGLDVSPVTVAACSTFVDSVSFAADSEYSYTPTTSPTQCMSAVGLLSRMYLGSPKHSPFFKTGFTKLTSAGPDPNNIYLNYYVSIALHHYGGPLWNEWNSRMRPMLVSQQVRNGPAKGSWALRDPWGNAGGQIYQTCLSTLCLEVYYRYLPMFATDGNDAAKDREKP